MTNEAGLQAFSYLMAEDEIGKIGFLVEVREGLSGGSEWRVYPDPLHRVYDRKRNPALSTEGHRLEGFCGSSDGMRRYAHGLARIVGKGDVLPNGYKRVIVERLSRDETRRALVALGHADLVPLVAKMTGGEERSSAISRRRTAPSTPSSAPSAPTFSSVRDREAENKLLPALLGLLVMVVGAVVLALVLKGR